MAKGSQFWGNASGKLGQQVLYRAGGEQRARMYVAKIKNPKTRAQMANRILMNNMVSMFRSMRPILSQSFPTRKSNQSGFNAFVSANKNVNMFAIDKEMLEAGCCVPYDMVISKGTMGLSLTNEIQEIGGFFEKDAPSRFYHVLKGLNLAKTTLRIPKLQAEDSEPLTPAQLYELIVGDSNPLGLPSEFTITIIGAEYAADDDDLGNDIWQLGAVQYTCSASGNGSIKKFGMPLSKSITDIVPIVTKETAIAGNEDETDITIEGLKIGAGAVGPSEAVDICVGVIISAKTEAGLVVSTSKMSPAKPYVNEDMDEPVRPYALDFAPGGDMYEEILNNVGYNAESTL